MKHRILLHQPTPDLIQALEQVPGLRASVELIPGDPQRRPGEQARDLRAAALILDCLALGHETKRVVAETQRICAVPILLLCDYVRTAPEAVIDALAEGAVDFAESPLTPWGSRDGGDLLVRLQRLWTPRGRRTTAMPRGSTTLGSLPLFIVGVSTGGPSTLETLVAGLPADMPGAVLLVQHMPPGLTGALAERLARASALPVREARDGDRVGPRQVLIAPGGHHLAVRGSGRLELLPPEGATRHVPSIDLAMVTAARSLGGGVVGVLLTGMGKDGVLGLHAIRESGGITMAQDEASSVLYGMPKAARDLGVADTVVALDRIAGEIDRVARRYERVFRRDPHP